jgi:hypothetical protein
VHQVLTGLHWTLFRAAAVVWQIMTELNDAASEEKKIVAIKKIVLKLMDVDGH